MPPTQIPLNVTILRGRKGNKWNQRSGRNNQQQREGVRDGDDVEEDDMMRKAMMESLKSAQDVTPTVPWNASTALRKGEGRDVPEEMGRQEAADLKRALEESRNTAFNCPRCAMTCKDIEELQVQSELVCHHLQISFWMLFPMILALQIRL